MKEIDSSGSDEVVQLAPLGTELETFEALLPGLLETNPGEWALIKEAELGGIFPQQMDAINAGYEMYGHTPFLTRQILERQPEIFYNFSQAA